MRPIILLVEDEETDAYFVGWAIRKAGCNWDLKHVEDGHRAVEYLERANEFESPESSPKPNLILLDLNMPRMGGRVPGMAELATRPARDESGHSFILGSSDRHSARQNLGS